MNIASWIILIIVVIWVGIAVKIAFFGGSRKRAATSPKNEASLTRGASDDAEHRADVPQCGGCDKASCASCPFVARDIPMPTIHEIE